VQALEPACSAGPPTSDSYIGGDTLQPLTLLPMPRRSYLRPLDEQIVASGVQPSCTHLAKALPRPTVPPDLHQQRAAITGFTPSHLPQRLSACPLGPTEEEYTPAGGLPRVTGGTACPLPASGEPYSALASACGIPRKRGYASAFQHQHTPCGG
jgi:hypothetical protein